MAHIDLGIDFGTSNTVIFARNKGIVLKEPTVLAVEKDTDRLIACGREAYDMIGKNPPNIEVIQPVEKGVVSQFQYARMLIRYFFKKVFPYRVIRPRIAISLPSYATEVEQRAVFETVACVGVRKTVMIHEAVAAAIGAGLDILAPRGCMIVDIGGGTTDMAVLSLGGTVTTHSAPIGGNLFNDAITRYIHDIYNVYIGYHTAERVKRLVGCAGGVSSPASDDPILVPGRDAVSGLPVKISFHPSEGMAAVEECVQQLVQAIQSMLEITPPELVGDVLEDGIVLSGGTALLPGLRERLEKEIGVGFRVADNPTDCVAIGAGKADEYLPNMQSGMYSTIYVSNDNDDWE